MVHMQENYLRIVNRSCLFYMAFNTFLWKTVWVCVFLPVCLCILLNEIIPLQTTSCWPSSLKRVNTRHPSGPFTRSSELNSWTANILPVTTSSLSSGKLSREFICIFNTWYGTIKKNDTKASQYDLKMQVHPALLVWRT